jgi:hypothetical protein
MIYFGSGITQVFNPFEGADPGTIDSDQVARIRGNDPIVMENRINALGRFQATDAGRSLAGIQIAGGGKGNDFVVTMLFGRFTPGRPTNFTQDDVAAGINVFLYQGSSEAELDNRKQDALARARAFVAGTSLPEWRACEMAGANDGPEFMGMFVIWRDVPD